MYRSLVAFVLVAGLGFAYEGVSFAADSGESTGAKTTAKESKPTKTEKHPKKASKKIVTKTEKSEKAPEK